MTPGRRGRGGRGVSKGHARQQSQRSSTHHAKWGMFAGVRGLPQAGGTNHLVDKQAEHAAHVLDQQGFTVHHRGSGFRGRLLLGGETFSRPLTDGQERLADALALADGGAVAGSGKTTLAVKEGYGAWTKAWCRSWSS